MLIFRVSGNLIEDKPLYYRVETVIRVSLPLCNLLSNLAFPKGCKVRHTDERLRRSCTSMSKYIIKLTTPHVHVLAGVPSTVAFSANYQGGNRKTYGVPQGLRLLAQYTHLCIHL